MLEFGESGDRENFSNELRDPTNAISQLSIGAGATDDQFTVRGMPAQTLNLLANDLVTESEASTARLVAIEQPEEGGTVTLNQDEGTVSFTRAAGFKGDAVFSYKLATSGNCRGAAEVKVRVRPIWHNESNPLDVDGDRHVVPRDILHMVNAIKVLGAGSIEQLETHLSAPEALDGGNRQFDVNNDGHFSPLDILLVLNEFRSESEAPRAAITPQFVGPIALVLTAEGEGLAEHKATHPVAEALVDRAFAESPPQSARTQARAKSTSPNLDTTPRSSVDIESLDHLLGEDLELF